MNRCNLYYFITAVKKLSYRRATATRTVSWNLVNWCTNVRKITCEEACNRRMTLKVTQGHWNGRYSISLPIGGL